MSEIQQTTIADFIKTNGLTMRAQRIEKRPDKKPITPEDKRWDKEASHYLVTIAKGGHGTGKGPETGSLTTYYSMGSAHKNPPTLDQVLDCLASDAAGYQNARSFEDWAGDYGYDTDSRTAEKTYNTIGEQVEALKSLLGDSDLYEQLLFHTERL